MPDLRSPPCAKEILFGRAQVATGEKVESAAGQCGEEREK
ncbi:hypothetical protein TIFTF001_004308 [Ficus carica]|uniref:Uncharacterized protein n=1 Tax=Ficus carica TaxID=3494 RepID=A0AA88CT03_FICCA|nr:hypothetical protein TIFTF001_004308 [Ficus carica]